MNDEIKQIKESFSMVMSAYFSYFQIEPVDVEIICTEKIATIYKQKRPDLFEGEYPIHPEDVERNRGLTIPPRTTDEKFTIVIKQEYFWESVKNQDWQWVGTLTHEMTHVLDYINYVKMNGLDNFDIVQRELFNRPFVLWTEFHARATGYLFIRQFVFGDKYNDKYDKAQTDYILQIELPYQIKWFAQQYEAANGNADIQLYETMQFMGRYSVWEKLFPNVFNGKLRKHIFGSNPWMIDMYEFLIKHQDIESANKNYDQMFGIIKENFGGF